MKKRVVTLLLAAAMTVSLLAGCGSEAGNTSSGTGETSEAGDATEANVT